MQQKKSLLNIRKKNHGVVKLDMVRQLNLLLFLDFQVLAGKGSEKPDVSPAFGTGWPRQPPEMTSNSNISVTPIQPVIVHCGYSLTFKEEMSYRIIEHPRLKGTSEGPLVQSFMGKAA